MNRLKRISLSSYLTDYLEDAQDKLKTLSCALSEIVREAARIEYGLPVDERYPTDPTVYMMAREALASYNEYITKQNQIQKLSDSLKHVLVFIHVDDSNQAVSLEVSIPNNADKAAGFDILTATAAEFSKRIKDGFVITTGAKSVFVTGSPPPDGWNANNWFLKTCFTMGSYGWAVGSYINDNFPQPPEQAEPSEPAE